MSKPSELADVAIWGMFEDVAYIRSRMELDQATVVQKNVKERIQSAIEEAVREEREACAQYADSLAATIRARGAKEPRK